MILSLRPTELPFGVGDTVWVDQPYGATNEFPFFQGTIMQIILDGSLANTLVIRHQEKVHELTVGNAIYGLKPIGDHAGGPRVNVNVQLVPLQINLFATKDELLAYQDKAVQTSHWVVKGNLCYFLRLKGSGGCGVARAIPPARFLYDNIIVSNPYTFFYAFLIVKA